MYLSGRVVVGKKVAAPLRYNIVAAKFGRPIYWTGAQWSDAPLHPSRAFDLSKAERELSRARRREPSSRILRA